MPARGRRGNTEVTPQCLRGPALAKKRSSSLSSQSEASVLPSTPTHHPEHGLEICLDTEQNLEEDDLSTLMTLENELGYSDEGEGRSLNERLARVSDPVAFMTNASYSKAWEDPLSEDGFFGQARAECASLMACFSDSLLLPHGDSAVAYLTKLDEVYAAIVATASLSSREIRDAARREEVAYGIVALVDLAYGELHTMEPEHVGEEHLSRAMQSVKDFRLFMLAWPAASGMSEHTVADPRLYGNFLQTFERYRQILNQYGHLEDRGGDATGTSRKEVKKGDGYYARDSESFDQAVLDHGGLMALALKSYGLEADRIQKYGLQIAEMVERLLDGEFREDTEREFIAALREHVGGGQASEAFYQRIIEDITSAGVETWLVREHSELIEERLREVQRDRGEIYGQAQESSSHIDDATGHAKSREDNIGLDVSFDDLRDEPGAQDAYNEGAETTYRYMDDVTLGHHNQVSQSSPRVHGHLESVYYQELYGLTQEAHYHGTAKQDQYIAGTFSEQEIAIRSVDQSAADDALAKAKEQRRLADDKYQHANIMHGDMKEDIEGIEQMFMEADYHNTKAKTYTHAIDLERNPELAYAKDLLIDEQDALDQRLSELSREYEDLKSYHDSLNHLLSQLDQDISAYDPERLRVPVPTAVVDGVELRQERYDNVKVTLNFPIPAAPVLSVYGYIEGTSTKSSRMDGSDLWSKARVEIGGGVRADLWLVQVAIGAAGFFEAEVRGDVDPATVLRRGAEELLRWVYAWWYNARPIGSRVLGAVEEANSVVNSVFRAAQSKIGDPDFDDYVTRGAREQLSDAYSPLVKTFADLGFSGVEADLYDSVLGIIDFQMINDRLKALDGADEEEAREELVALSREHATMYQSGYDELEGTLAEADPGRNDPDVRFTAGVALDVSASLGRPKTSQLKASSRSTLTIRDGDGEGFDLSVHATTSRKLKVESKGASIEVGDSTMYSSSGELERSLMAEVVVPLASAPDDVSLLAEALKTRAIALADSSIGGPSAESVQSSLMEVKWEDLLSLGGIGSNLSLRVGIDFIRKGSGVSGRLSIGIEQGREASLGGKGLSVDVEMTSGYRVVLDF